MCGLTFCCISSESRQYASSFLPVRDLCFIDEDLVLKVSELLSNLV